MKHFLLLILALGFLSQPAYSQIYPTKYRPPDLNWQQLTTPHFNIVFPEGEDSVAYRTARILEYQYPEVQQLVGGELIDFPIVLNNFNDRSNGFVSTLHFRSEIEIPTIKGKTMNPRSGNWLETVVPHELVHALHHSHLKGIWANILSIFSPDGARSLHGTVPLGVHEGIATYHETAGVAPNGGRGTYPYFSNQFDAIFDGTHRWSMGQMLATSSYSRPFDRHYIGGYEFTDWLHQTYGDSTTNKSIDFFIRWPFLGYGTALRHTTGKWPGQLYDRFEEGHKKEIETKGAPSYEPLPIPYEGATIRRPIWLSNQQLLMYGSFYNAEQGFYSYSLSDNSMDPLLETRSVQDYNYDLSQDRTKLLFSDYRSSSIYDNTFKMDLFELDITNGSVERLSGNLRAFAPVYRKNGFLALQTDQESTALLRLSSTNSGPGADSRISLPDTEFVSVKPNPANPQQLAIVANRRGLQGLWFANADSIRQQLSSPPDISFMEGSVFDPAWHPKGDRIMFSSDHTGTMQLYEYDFSDNLVTQITTADFNAMEGSYSPDGERIAFIIQRDNERLPVILDRTEFLNLQVSYSRWTSTPKKIDLMAQKELGASLKKESTRWDVSDYQSNGEWLLPRAISPFYEEVSNSNTYEAGFNLNSNDLLQRNSYHLGISYVQNRLWYDLNYRHKGFFPGFELNAFSEPRFSSISFETQSGTEETFTLLQQDQGFSLGMPTRFILENNAHFSSVGFTPSLKMEGTRFFELDHNGNPASDFANSFRANLFAFVNYKLQRNIRDLQPNSGLIFFSELEQSFSSRVTNIQTENYQIEVNFPKPTAWRSGLIFFTAPLKLWNQSLRIGIEGLTQTAPTFDTQNLVSNGFSEPVFPTSRNLMSFNTRYTIPLFYPDNGGFLFPAYLSSVYLVGFSDTVADLDKNTSDNFFEASRTVFGIGLRTRFRISNLTFDMGVAIGFEPTRNQIKPFIGNF